MESFDGCVRDSTSDNGYATLTRAFRCCVVSEYRPIPTWEPPFPEPDVAVHGHDHFANNDNGLRNMSITSPSGFTMGRPGWDSVQLDGAGNFVLPEPIGAALAPRAMIYSGPPFRDFIVRARPQVDEDVPKMPRKELEARVEELRKSTPKCEAYTQDKVDYESDVNLVRRSGNRHLSEAFELIEHIAKKHVLEVNRRPMTLPRIVHMGLADFVQVYLPAELNRKMENIWNGDVTTAIDKYFSINGDANLAGTRPDQLKIWRERQYWATTILRTYALDMSGAVKSNVLLQGAASPIPFAPNTRGDRHTLLYERAKDYVIPSAEKVRQGVKAGSTSSHPNLAAFRHYNVAGLRELVNEVGAEQQDISISSASRDKLAYGIRQIITLKDWKHLGPSQPPAVEEQHKQTRLGGCKPIKVTTMIDTAMYLDSLSPWCGTSMIITVPMYYALSGKTAESTWYCTGVDPNGNALYCETIGSDEVSSVFHNQFSWWFTNNDVVYIRTEDDSAFGIYNIVKHTRRDINRQTVFLCLDIMVNMPFAVADRLVYTAHGTHLSDMFSEPRPCRNVIVVNPASTNPILLMNAGSAQKRRLYTRYQKETSPEGTAVVSPAVLRYLEHLHSNGGRSYGLSSQEHLTRLQLFMKDDFPGGHLNAPDYASLLELLRVVGVPDNLPNAVFYAEGYAAEHPGEEAPSEDRTAKAVQKVPPIEYGPKVYSVIASNDAAIAAATDAHLGEGNTTKRGSQLNNIVKFASKHFIESMSDQSGCTPGSILVVPREEVIANRTRPSQVAAETTYGLGPSGKPPRGIAFPKSGEVAATKGAPRMIQSPPHDLSIDSGRLGMSIDRILKRKHGESNGIDWYAPGKTPSEMAAALCGQYKTCHAYRENFAAGRLPQVDYKAADDSHTEESAQLMADIIEYFFSAEHCPDLGMSHKAWALQTYWGCFGFPVQAGPKVKSTKWKNASGTGITTHLNTLVFAFRAYLTVLMSLCFQQLMGQGDTVPGMPNIDGKSDAAAAGTDDYFTLKLFHDQLRVLQNSGILYKAVGSYETAHAWGANGKKEIGSAVTTAYSNMHTPVMRLIFELIGLKFGDDGFECNVPGVTDSAWNLACAYLDAADGFTRTVTFSDPTHEESVEFLSRIYPKPLSTGVSYCKIGRAAEKLAISKNNEKETYRNKLVGYLVTDRFTPIIGAFIEAIWATHEMGPDPFIYSPGYRSEIRRAEDTATLSDKFLSKVEGLDRETAWKCREGSSWAVTENDLEYMYEVAGAQYNMTASELRAYDDALRIQTTLDGIRGCRLPVALANLTADDPCGDGLTKVVPPGVAMVEAWSKEERAALRPENVVRSRLFQAVNEVSAQNAV